MYDAVRGCDSMESQPFLVVLLWNKYRKSMELQPPEIMFHGMALASRYT